MQDFLFEAYLDEVCVSLARWAEERNLSRLLARIEEVARTSTIEKWVASGAYERSLAGLHLEIAEIAGVDDNSVRNWRKGLRRPRIEIVKILQHSRLAIPKHVMRPDIWPPPKTKPKLRRREPQASAAPLHIGSPIHGRQPRRSQVA